MASLLRQIVAGPRAQHAETGLDLCYVTSNIIATSGPSQTYPQLAYRNPLDRLVAFLDAKHGSGWAIWEFRAEGTGYPDSAVYHRIRHYPWPDHHPPPFKLVPMIMASMRNWLHGGPLGGEDKPGASGDRESKDKHEKDEKSNRVVVVHCKAGKGRSGTMACSYLISECGWKPEDALARFTERRMRPKFGAGISIPSQLRWISYVDRWTKGGKRYVDRPIEILEVRIWGLRHGVKVSIEGFVDEGKKIKVFHTFKKNERIIVEGDAPGSGGFLNLVTDMAGYGVTSPTATDDTEVVEEADYHAIAGDEAEDNSNNGPGRTRSKPFNSSRSPTFIQRLAKPKWSSSKSSINRLDRNSKSKTAPVADSSATINPDTPSPVSQASATLPHCPLQSQSQTALPDSATSNTFADGSEPGGRAVVFRSSSPLKLPNSDVNIALERRNRASAGLTMVTAVAHAWFNAFFEGGDGSKRVEGSDSGVFRVNWEQMDGIKGSSRKGARSCDRIEVVWKAVAVEDEESAKSGVVIDEPEEGRPVPQMAPADWKGGNAEDPEAKKGLGLRAEDPDSAAVSKASSMKSDEVQGTTNDPSAETDGQDDKSLVGVKTSGPFGEEDLHESEITAR